MAGCWGSRSKEGKRGAELGAGKEDKKPGGYAGKGSGRPGGVPGTATRSGSRKSGLRRRLCVPRELREFAAVRSSSSR